MTLRMYIIMIDKELLAEPLFSDVYFIHLIYPVSEAQTTFGDDESLSSSHHCATLGTYYSHQHALLYKQKRYPV